MSTIGSGTTFSYCLGSISVVCGTTCHQTGSHWVIPINGMLHEAWIGFNGMTQRGSRILTSISIDKLATIHLSCLVWSRRQNPSSCGATNAGNQRKMEKNLFTKDPKLRSRPLLQRAFKRRRWKATAALKKVTWTCLEALTTQRYELHFWSKWTFAECAL